MTFSLKNIKQLDFRNVEEECLLRGTKLRYMLYYLRKFQASEE